MSLDELYETGFLNTPDSRESFKNLFASHEACQIGSSSSQIRSMWDTYLASSFYPRCNDAIFNSLVTLMLGKQRIRPLYFQAQFYPFSNIEYECATYSKVYGPIIITPSLNITSKLSAISLKSAILKSIHRRSKSFLITMDERKAAVVNQKIGVGLVLGLDKVVVASSSGFDTLIQDLKSYTLYKPEPVDVLTSTRFIG